MSVSFYKPLNSEYTSLTSIISSYFINNYKCDLKTSKYVPDVLINDKTINKHKNLNTKYKIIIKRLNNLNYNQVHSIITQASLKERYFTESYKKNTFEINNDPAFFE